MLPHPAEIDEPITPERSGYAAGRRWAALFAQPRALYYLSIANPQPHEAHDLAAVVFPQCPHTGEAVRRLWNPSNPWPTNVFAIHTEEGAQYTRGFVDGALSIWQLLYDRFHGSFTLRRLTENGSFRSVTTDDIAGLRFSGFKIRSENIRTGDVTIFASPEEMLDYGYAPAVIIRASEKADIGGLYRDHRWSRIYTNRQPDDEED